jgi:hypothetical protein
LKINEKIISHIHPEMRERGGGRAMIEKQLNSSKTLFSLEITNEIKLKWEKGGRK